MEASSAFFCPTDPAQFTCMSNILTSLAQVFEQLQMLVRVVAFEETSPFYYTLINTNVAYLYID
jgi:hypothetical protein